MRVVRCRNCRRDGLTSYTDCALCGGDVCLDCMRGLTCVECLEAHSDDGETPLTQNFIDNMHERRGMDAFARDMAAGYDTGWHLNPHNRP